MKNPALPEESEGEDPTLKQDPDGKRRDVGPHLGTAGLHLKCSSSGY